MEKFHSQYKLGLLVALGSWVLSFGYIYALTTDFWSSLIAAVITAGLVCATYYIIYWIIMAFKR